MACIIVPAAEAIVTTVAAKILRSKEQNSENHETIRFFHKLGWLNKMLWGGTALLAFEHVWHGEIIPTFPFLTNAANPVDATEMLHEMATSGVGMALLVTGIWCGMVALSHLMEKHHSKEIQVQEVQQSSSGC